jgi:hypothetical protein
MDAHHKTLVVGFHFYVRETRTLVTASVAGGVGMPGSGLWAGGWRLDLAMPDLAETAPEHVPGDVALAFVTSERLEPMGQETIRAWQRTWRPHRP